jgi:hypothetical protein
MQRDDDKMRVIELKESNEVQSMVQNKLQCWVRRKCRLRKSHRSRGYRVGTSRTCMRPWAMHSTVDGANRAFMVRDVKTDTFEEDANTDRFQCLATITDS